MQKRVTVLIVLIGLIFLSVGFASAGSCDVKLKATCDAEGNYTVMGISGLTNAHGEFPYLSYEFVLCCDFGTGNTTCKTTLPENKIIGLSSSTNAHAEIPSNVEYTTSVCYEDLLCKSFSGACPIDPLYPTNWYGVEMLSLSADTNAHIGGFGDYPNDNICCRSDTYAASPCTFTNAYWSLSDTSPAPIESGDTALDGQEVYLIVEGISCARENISFEVWEYDSLFSDTLMDSNPPVNVIFGATAVGTWETKWEDDSLPFKGNGNPPEYYFIARVVESDPEEQIETTIQLNVDSETLDNYCIEGIYNCGNYDEENCNPDPCEVAETSVGESLPSGETCGEGGYECYCSWDGVDTCEGEWSYSEGEEEGGTCTITQVVQSECDEEPIGLFTYSWTGIWDGVGESSAKTTCLAGGDGETIECPAQVQLPLENWMGIVATIIIISLVYFFWSRKKQRKTSKNKSSKKRKKK